MDVAGTGDVGGERAGGDVGRGYEKLIELRLSELCNSLGGLKLRNAAALAPVAGCGCGDDCAWARAGTGASMKVLVAGE